MVQTSTLTILHTR